MISKITYGTLTGQLAPLIGYDVTFDGTEPSSNEEVADYQIKIRDSDYRSLALRINGPYPSAETVFKFLKPFTAAEKIKYIACTTDGQVSYPWQVMVTYTIVRLERLDWPVLGCNEIQYSFPADGNLPIVPNSFQTVNLIIPPKGKGNHVNKVFDLITETDGRWGVLHEVKHVWRKIIYSEEGE